MLFTVRMEVGQSLKTRSFTTAVAGTPSAKAMEAQATTSKVVMAKMKILLNFLIVASLSLS
jgi:hypothetical protein